jgi:hypothetical protein
MGEKVNVYDNLNGFHIKFVFNRRNDDEKIFWNLSF